jgi:hypothetical protein
MTTPTNGFVLALFTEAHHGRATAFFQYAFDAPTKVDHKAPTPPKTR